MPSRSLRMVAARSLPFIGANDFVDAVFSFVATHNAERMDNSQHIETKCEWDTEEKLNGLPAK